MTSDRAPVGADVGSPSPPAKVRRRRSQSERAAAYLLEQGLLSSRQVLEDGVRLTASGSDRAVTVQAHVGAGGGWVVKLGRRGNPDWVRREARCYGATKALASAPPITPEVLRADERRAIVVTRLVDPGRTLHDFFTGGGRLDGPEVDSLARTLAALHAGTVDPAPELPDEMPWILGGGAAGAAATAADQDGMWALFGHGADRRALRAGVAAARRSWRRHCLIHGDVKWDNCLLADNPDGPASVLLIDWELGGRGDPAWDVATAVQEFLVTPAPPRPGGDALSSVLGSEAGGALGRLLSAYARAAGLGGRTELRELIERTSLYAGTRLIQSACELASVEQGLGALAAGALGLAEAVCRDPGALAGELLRKVTSR